MTRNEFIQQAMLTMLGNTRCFSGVSHTRESEIQEITKSAVKMADEAEKVAPFDVKP